MKKILVAILLIVVSTFLYAQSDECATATVITPTAFGTSCSATASGTTVSATASASAPSCANPAELDDDVWYRFTATSSSVLMRFSDIKHAVNNTPDYLSFAVYESSCPSSGSSFYCISFGIYNAGNRIVSGLTAGNVYYIRIWSFSTNTADDINFNMCVQSVTTQANDECSNAINITTQPFGTSCAASVSANTTGATHSSPDPSCAAADSDDDIWYSFTANSQSIILRFSNAVSTVDGSSAILGFAMYNSPCPATTSTFACNSFLGFIAGHQIIDGLTIGNTYYLRLFSTGVNNYISFNFCVQDVPPPPANNECANALAIITQPFGTTCAASVSANTSGATHSSPDPACAAGDSNDDLWYSFTASSQSVILRYSNAVITTDGGTGSIGYALYNTPCPSTTTTLSCASGFAFGAGHQIIDGLTIGNTYYLRLFSFGGNNYISFNFCVQDAPPPPANNECAGAITITPQPFGTSCAVSVSANTSGATRSSPDPACAVSDCNDDIWYSFTATSQSVVLRYSNTIVTTDGNPGSIGYALYNSSCPSTTSTFACSSGFGFAAGLNIIDGLTIGNTYYLRLYSYGGNNYISFNFCVQQVPPPPANNECAGAIHVPLTLPGTYCQSSVQSTTTGATHSTPDPSCGVSDSNDDIWYTFTANASAAIFRYNNLYFTTTGEPGSLGYELYTGCPGSGSSVVCNGGFGFINGGVVFTGLTSGNTYYLRLFTYAAHNYASFGFCIQQPLLNDECTGAINVPVTNGFCSTPLVASLNGATTSAGFASPSCSPGSESHDVWFKATVPATGNLIVQTSAIKPVSNDLTMTAFSGVCGSLTQIACDVNSNPEPYPSAEHSRITLTGRTPGEIIIFRVTPYHPSAEEQFAICAWDETTAVLPAIAAGGNCITGAVRTIDTTQGNIYMWVPILDNSGNIIAEIYPDGNNLGTITPDVFVNSAAVRQYSGQYYLDRNITLQTGNAPVGNVKLRMYLKNAELTALQAADPSVTGISSLGISKTATTCQNVYPGNGSTIGVTGTAVYNGNHYLQSNINSFSSFYFSKGFSTLPVYFENVVAYAIADDNLVKWRINGLDEVTAMVLERSNDGLTFSAASSFAINNSILVSSFEYRDINPSEKNTYYRIKITTISGKYMYSVIRLVKREGKMLTVAGLWPNPAVDMLNITLSGKKINKANYSLTNAAGIIVREKSNVVVGNNQFSISVAGLRPGLYFLAIKEPVTGENVISKLIIQ